MPETVLWEGIEINDEALPDEFARFFENKINLLSRKANIDQMVYNGQTIF